MEDNINNNSLTTDNSKQTDNGKLTIITTIAIIIAFCGIGFGIFEFIDNSNKTKQIDELQNQINQLAANSSNNANEKKQIKIVSSSWSDQPGNYESEKNETYCEIILNKKCTVMTRQFSDAEGNEREEEVFSFEITNIHDDSIDIHTFQPFSSNEKAINTNSKAQDFTIESESSLELNTPTLDAGEKFVLTLPQ